MNGLSGLESSNLLAGHQLEAVRKLANGKILCGGVGTGKSRTALGYFVSQIPRGTDLYIITTAKKRDSGDWVDEANLFGISTDLSLNAVGHNFKVDSWNKIKDYTETQDAFFIFDEQRLVGSGAWVKAFYKIAKANRWILLSATPGDTWMDYIPVFVANGFYKNKAEFVRDHVVYKHMRGFLQVDRFVGVRRLEYFREQLLVPMHYKRKTTRIRLYPPVEYDRAEYIAFRKARWNPYKDLPIDTAAELTQLLRRLSQSHISRLKALLEALGTRKRAIVFYNYNYELEFLREEVSKAGYKVAEYNGQKHEEVPIGDKWAYLVQYTAGAEGWNCTTADTIIFWSLNYSWRVMEQCEGRIDRLNTPHEELYYYYLCSSSPVDRAVKRAIENKRVFNEATFSRKEF